MLRRQLFYRGRDAHVPAYETVLCTYEDEAAFQTYEDFRVFCDFCETLNIQLSPKQNHPVVS